MLKSKIAMAMAAAMVLAALYGCSSSDSGLKNDLVVAEGNVTALQGTIDAIADALGLPAGSDQAAIMTALATATADQLVDVRAALDLATDADSAAIVAAIVALATADQLVDIRAELDLATDADSAAIVAAIAALQAGADERQAADLKTEYLHEQAVVAGINAMDDVRPMVGTVAVDYALKASVTDLKAADEGAPDAGMSVQAMLTATDEMTKTTDKAFVYSNRMAAGNAEWNKYYDMDDRMVDGTTPLPGMAAVASVEGVDDEGENATGDEIVTYRLTFASDVSDDSARFMAAALPSSDRQTFNYAENADDDDTDDNRKFDGSFHGVMGEYECTNTCTAITNMDGELVTLTGTWTFTPAEVAEDADPHMVMGVDPDETYVSFGYWLRQSFDDDDKETVGVNTFSGGDAMMSPSDAGELECGGIAAGGKCSASYSGKAGGKYVVKTVTARAEVATLYTGQFVADVTLNANFGGDTIAVADEDEISGSITGFEDAADDMDRIAHWTVKLGTAETDSDIDGANIGMTNDGMMGGTWTHAFYSRQAANAETTGVDEEDMPPGAVAGAFDAHWSDGHAIGAYGATKD